MKFLTQAIAVAVVALESSLAQAEASADLETSTAATCCSKLQKKLGSTTVVFPDTQPYTDSLASYWTGQAGALTPNCIVFPTSSQDVKKALKTILDVNGCKFAVRSGGHMPWAGSNNIDKGVTFDLSKLNSITLSSDRKTASIEPGARWADVYRTLDPLKVSVVGGRINTVGVGGLVTGGGNSFFTARKGLAVDNIKNYELILGTGEIVQASKKSNPDLYLALKGGSNNLGIVTRFDYEAFEQGDLWGGFIINDINSTAQNIDVFVNFTNRVAQYPYASLVQIYTFSGSTGLTALTNQVDYTEPVFGAHPPAYAELEAIKPQLFNNVENTNLSYLVGFNGAQQPRAARDLFLTYTFANDARIMSKSLDFINEALQPIAHIQDLVWNSIYEPWPRLFADIGISKGGNILGIDRFDNNLIQFLIFASWNSDADTAAINKAAGQVLDKLDAYARKLKGDTDWVYLNYANATQDPLKGYGQANLMKLSKASKKYDPDQVFQKRCPGGFKISKQPGF